MRNRIFWLKIFLFFFLPVSYAANPGDSLRINFNGQPILRVFANFHVPIEQVDGRSAFEVDRAYIGYKADLNKHFEIKINLDIGSPDDVSEYSRIRRYAYFKNAALKYSGKWFTSSFGLIDMTHFKIQESTWGHRYIERSFADRFRFGPSADLGWNFVASPLEILDIDLTISNGEGYNNLQRDNTLKLGMGLNIKPVKGLTLRVYGDIMEKTIIESTLAAFIGYQYGGIISAGVEYNHKFNESYKDGYQRYGYSAYASYSFRKDLQAFIRYDWVGSNMPDGLEIPWNLNNDGSSLIGGLQYMPVRHVRIALNYRDWFPYASNEPNESYLFLNLEFLY
jgi:hypothetical protein